MNFVRTLLPTMACAGLLSAQVTRIDLATVAPKDSPWHEVLVKMGQEWKTLSRGKVRLRTFAGGVQGDEVEMLRKMRTGQLQAVAFSGIGLAHIEPAVACLGIPMMLDSYEALDYVRDRIAPKLEAGLAAKGYLVLNWGDVGWVHFFTRKPARTLDEIRPMRLFISAGDPQAEKLYTDFGFHPNPMLATEMLTSLKMGTIDAFDVPPLFALIDQSFALAPNMLDLKWAPLVGATIVRKEAWEAIPEALRPALLEAARAAGEQMRGRIRKMGEDAVPAMQKLKLNVIRLDAATMAEWRRQVEAAWPKLRGRLVTAELFDEVKRLRDEFRTRRAAVSGASPVKAR